MEQMILGDPSTWPYLGVIDSFTFLFSTTKFFYIKQNKYIYIYIERENENKIKIRYITINGPITYDFICVYITFSTQGWGQHDFTHDANVKAHVISTVFMFYYLIIVLVWSWICLQNMNVKTDLILPPNKRARK